MATVKKDGTVQFEVPGDIKAPSLDLGNGMASGENAEEEQLDSVDVYDLPPMQIVMLIVGTRGDVQPFVAIGKRLQVSLLPSFPYYFCHWEEFVSVHLFTFHY